MRRLFSLRSRYFLTVCLFSCIVGCQRGNETTELKPAPVNKNDSSTSQSVTSDEGTAKDKLRIALESWQFGDSAESLKQKHPEIDSFDSFGAVVDYLPYKPKLQKFEITTGRTIVKSDAGSLKFFEFNVIHTFESKAGTEIKKSHIYEIHTSNGKGWTIHAKMQ